MPMVVAPSRAAPGTASRRLCILTLLLQAESARRPRQSVTARRQSAVNPRPRTRTRLTRTETPVMPGTRLSKASAVLARSGLSSRTSTSLAREKAAQMEIINLPEVLVAALAVILIHIRCRTATSRWALLEMQKQVLTRRQSRCHCIVAFQPKVKPST